MKIAIGNDHAGTEYKFAIIELLEKLGHSVVNFGTDTNESVDYPDHVHPVAFAVENNLSVLSMQKIEKKSEQVFQELTQQ